MAVTSYTPDNLDAGIIPTLTRDVVVASGSNLARGCAVKVTTGKVSALLTTETFYGIMEEAVDATSGDTTGSMYVFGALVESEVDFGTGDADEFREAAQDRGIYLVEGK